MNERRLLHLALAIFVCRAVIAAFIIPPWQGPDEPPHYVMAEQVARGAIGDPPVKAQLEAQVLRSMAAHDWWRPYGLATPNPVPTSFSQEPDHLGTGAMVHPVYYRIAGGVLRMSGAGTLDGRYLVLRLLSSGLSMLTIVMAYAGTRLLFDRMTASIVVFLAAFHPQFLLTALSTTPDALANAFGALVWWQAARVFVYGSADAAVVTAAAAIAATLTKRNAVPLLAVSGLVAMICVWRRLSTRVAVAIIAAGCVVLLVVAVWFVRSPAEWVAQLRYQWYTALFQNPAARDFSLRRFTTFTLGLLDSSWLVAGWLRFPAPSWWLTTVRVLTIASFAGVGRALVRKPNLRAALWLAIGVAAPMVLAAVANGLMTGSAPQGRYLFVVAAPMALLFWIGLAEWWPASMDHLAAPAVIALLFLLDLSGWITTILPAYA